MRQYELTCRSTTNSSYWLADLLASGSAPVRSCFVLAALSADAIEALPSCSVLLALESLSPFCILSLSVAAWSRSFMVWSLAFISLLRESSAFLDSLLLFLSLSLSVAICSRSFMVWSLAFISLLLERSVSFRLEGRVSFMLGDSGLLFVPAGPITPWLEE